MITEQAYSDALTMIAVGETLKLTAAHVKSLVPNEHTADEILRDALRDALRQGVEREDIDPSWFQA